MKTKSLLAIFVFSLMVTTSCAQTLEGIQKRIKVAFITAVKGDLSSLQQIRKSLSVTPKNGQTRIQNYWKAYTDYKLAVAYLSNKDKQSGDKLNEEGIKLLTSIKRKNSEEYALLGMMTSLRISFDPMAAMLASKEARNYYDKAAKLDPKNLRAYLGKGSSDFYTPKQYGGGLIAEGLFLKALSLKDTYVTTPHAPTWGREEVYMLLVRFHRRESENQKALLYCKQGLKKYPYNPRLAKALKELSK